MKILKPGKVEMRKFVCPNCECEFEIYKSETIRTMDLEGGYHYWAQCPCRDQIAWDKGEPYEEHTQEKTDGQKIVELISDYDGELDNLKISHVRALRFVSYLTDNGVTFREEQQCMT